MLLSNKTKLLSFYKNGCVFSKGRIHFFKGALFFLRRHPFLYISERGGCTLKSLTLISSH